MRNDWDSIIPNLQSGNYDVIIAGMSITDEREEVIDFSQGYLPPASSAYLAAAADADVMGEWAGLGYYARARNLLACARAVARTRAVFATRASAPTRRRAFATGAH